MMVVVPMMMAMAVVDNDLRVCSRHSKNGEDCDEKTGEQGFHTYV